MCVFSYLFLDKELIAYATHIVVVVVGATLFKIA